MTGVHPAETIVPIEKQIKDNIRSYSSSDYQSIIKTASKDLYDTEGVQFVGQFGSTQVPGASDIDLLVVVKDTKYEEVREFSRRLVVRNSDYEYLFWHEPTIVPESLISEAATLHTLDNLQPLYGKEAIFDQITSVPKTKELEFIQSSVWNSFFWRTLSSLSNGTHGIRKLLLILSNAVQSAAANYRLVGEEKNAQQIIKSVKQRGRKEIIELPNKRTELVISYLRKSINALYSSEWVVQKWFSNKYNKSNSINQAKCLGVSRDFMPYGGTIFYFTDLPDCESNIARWAKKLKFPSAKQIELPKYYLTTLPEILSAFGIDRLSNPTYISENLQYSIKIFCKKVLNVRKIAEEVFNDEFQLFQETFIVPFGLSPYTRLHRLRNKIY